MSIAYDHDTGSWRPEAPYFPERRDNMPDDLSLVRSQVFLTQEEAALRASAPTLAADLSAALAEVARLTAERDRLRLALEQLCNETDEYDDHDGRTGHISYASIQLARAALSDLVSPRRQP